MSVFIELCVCMCAFTLTSLMIAWLRGVDWCSKRTPDWQQCVLLAFHLEATVAFCVCICVPMLFPRHTMSHYRQREEKKRIINSYSIYIC